MNLLKLQEMRSLIDDSLKAELSRKPELKRNKALALARKYAPNLTDDNLADWINFGLVNPVIEEGRRNIFMFGRDQITEILLTYKLHYDPEYKLSYTDILTLLLQEERWKNESGKSYIQPIADELPSNQKNRAISILRSRILGIILTWFFSKRIPENMLILVRKSTRFMLELEKGIAKAEFAWINRDEAQDEIGLVRKDDDVFGHVSPESEVLFSGLNYTNLRQTPYKEWLLIRIFLGEPSGEYILMFGFEPSTLDKNQVDLSSIEEKKYILGLLLAVVHSQGKDISPGELEKQDHSTALRSLAEVIPTLSKNWEYCAILAKKVNNHDQLEIKAASQSFPKDLLKNMPNIQVDYGEALSGWSIQWDYPIKIQQIGPDDSWPAFQEMEKAWAGFAVPSHANGRSNGVLYIGTSQKKNIIGPVFDDNDARVLQILAEVIGELIERNLIRRSIETNALRIIHKPECKKQNWMSLKQDISQSIEAIRDQKVGEMDNLHFTVVKTEINDETATRHPGLASWYPDHVLETTWEFITRNYAGTPSLYLHKDNPKEFAIFMPDVQITDENDRELRNKLKNLLCSLDINFSAKDHAVATAYLWTIPFRKENIKSRLFGQPPVEKVIDFSNRIVQDGEDLFVQLPFREKAHEKERNKDFQGAVELYMRAWYFSRNNTYLIRHIAKTYELIHEYQNSIDWWKLLIQKEYCAYALTRCARAYALAGQFSKSLALYAEAWERSLQEGENPVMENQSPQYPKSLDILVSWSDVLLSTGAYDLAIEHYQKALEYAAEDCDGIWMSMAEAYARRYHQTCEQQDLFEAISNTKLVLRKKPDNRDAWKMLLYLSSLSKTGQPDAGKPDDLGSI
jgi:tetratricopeptide (TPR) repeat protein